MLRRRLLRRNLKHPREVHECDDFDNFGGRAPNTLQDGVQREFHLQDLEGMPNADPQPQGSFARLLGEPPPPEDPNIPPQHRAQLINDFLGQEEHLSTFVASLSDSISNILLTTSSLGRPSRAPVGDSDTPDDASQS